MVHSLILPFANHRVAMIFTALYNLGISDCTIQLVTVHCRNFVVLFRTEV